MTKGTRVVAYTRVSTGDQGENGNGLAAQRDAIQDEADRRGWVIVATLEDVASGAAMRRRPGLAAAIDTVERGDADALVAAKLDRLSRSSLDFAQLADRAKRRGWQLVVLDLGVDMTTPVGEMIASVLSNLAQFERRLIAERTRDALAVKRRRGERVGRPAGELIPAPVRERIVQLRADGMSRHAIANLLTAEGVPTAAGGERWYPSTIKRVLDAAAR